MLELGNIRLMVISDDHGYGHRWKSFADHEAYYIPVYVIAARTAYFIYMSGIAVFSNVKPP